VIRQAISCDICGAEKRQTNHWFIATERGGQLRVSGWSDGSRLRTGTKHLCGQACLHKLADEFMERVIARPQQSDPAIATCAIVTAPQIVDEFESSARLIPVSGSIGSPTAPRPAATLVSMPDRLQAEVPASLAQESPRYASRSWHAEAWQRERERARRMKTAASKQA